MNREFPVIRILYAGAPFITRTDLSPGVGFLGPIDRPSLGVYKSTALFGRHQRHDCGRMRNAGVATENSISEWTSVHRVLKLWPGGIPGHRPLVGASI